jgi:NAD-dependent SIR2 family protein deacetylase
MSYTHEVLTIPPAKYMDFALRILYNKNHYTWAYYNNRRYKLQAVNTNIDFANQPLGFKVGEKVYILQPDTQHAHNFLNDL